MTDEDREFLQRVQKEMTFGMCLNIDVLRAICLLIKIQLGKEI